MKIEGDEAKLRPEVEDIPVVAAKHANRRRCVSLRYERPILMGQQSNERRLPGAVGTENRGVLTLLNRQRQTFKDRTFVSDDRCVTQLENRL